MSFTWDWLLTNMISFGITDYYQVNVCNNYSDFMLYRFGRSRGAMVTEVHIIKRTSKSRYLILSFDFDTVFLRSCRTVDEVCRYILNDFVPVEFRPVSNFEILERKRERRLKRAEYQKTRLGRLFNEHSEDRRDLERLIRLHRKFVSDMSSDEQGKSK